jgi:hypothetical protein
MGDTTLSAAITLIVGEDLQSSRKMIWKSTEEEEKEDDPFEVVH